MNKKNIDKQTLVDMVIEDIKVSIEAGDLTVLDELLMNVSNTVLLNSLPDDVADKVSVIPESATPSSTQQATIPITIFVTATGDIKSQEAAIRERLINTVNELIDNDDGVTTTTFEAPLFDMDISVHEVAVICTSNDITYTTI